MSTKIGCILDLRLYGEIRPGIQDKQTAMIHRDRIETVKIHETRVELTLFLAT